MPTLPLTIVHLVPTLDYVPFREKGALLLKYCSFSLDEVPFYLEKVPLCFKKVPFCLKTVPLWLKRLPF